MRQNLRNVKQAMTILPTDLLEYSDDGAEFRQFPSNTTPPVTPTRQKTEDNMVGDGRPYPKKGKAYRFDPRNIPVQGALTDTISVRLIRMALGGTVDDTDNTTPNLTTDSLIHMKDAGDVPLIYNLARELGGESLLHGDVFLQALEIDQQGDAEPSVNATLANSGHFKKLSATAIDTADFEDLTAYKKMHGVKTRMTFSDGVTSYDFANEGKLQAVNFQYNQNVIVEGMMGDPFVNTSAECQGAYSQNVYIDVQNAMIRATVYMDENFSVFDSWVADRTLTSISLLFRTCEIIVGTHLFEIELKIPIGEFNLTGTTQGNFAAYTFEIKAIEGDPTTGDLVQARIRHLTADDIEEIL